MSVWGKFRGAMASHHIAGLAAFLALGCSGGEVKIVDPPPTGSSGLKITIAPEPADQSFAQLLGWTSGIPGAEIRVTPLDSTVGRSQTFTADASGSASVSGLAPEQYVVEARRLLSASELAKFGTGRDPTGFAGRGTIHVSPTVSSAIVTIPASRRRSLLINEVSWQAVFQALPDGATYYDNGFIEMYNNSDTIIHLDGMTIGQPINIFRNYPDFPCSMFERFRNDATGIWAQVIFVFPGAGQDYPLAPGKLVVVAQDAIDHSGIFPGLPDLSGAAFEFTGRPGDVDNPASANLISRGGYTAPHGMLNMSLGGTIFVAAPVNFADLESGRDPRNDNVLSKFPAATILDTFSTVFPNDDYPENPYCSELVNRAFDRETGKFFSESRGSFQISQSRRSIGVTADSRPIVQSTRSSAMDFVNGPFSPGRM
ncbi:MAG: DUF4876 domain-containing protein [Gemmatimonadaceae bacterium]|nr:DUF4876 domain-containing protein [Gemmatimonadaceae bacterium]